MTCRRICFAATAALLFAHAATAQIILTQDANCFSDGVFDLDGTCISIDIEDPATGSHSVAAHTTVPLTMAGPVSLVNGGILTFDPVPTHFDPAGGIQLSSEVLANQLDLTISGAQSIGPSTGNPGTSTISMIVRINETFTFDDDTMPGQNLHIDVAPNISGSAARPANASAGLFSGSLEFSVISSLFDGPVQTPIFSASLRYDEADTGIQVTGNSASTFSFENLDAPVIGQSYLSQTPIFNTVQVTEGEAFTVTGTVFMTLSAQDFIDNNDTTGVWFSDFADTIQFTLTGPDTGTFTQVPEPGSAALLAIALPLIARRRR